MKDLAPNGAVADMGVGTTDWRRVIEAAGLQIAYLIDDFLPGSANSTVLKDPDKSLAMRPASQPIAVHDLMPLTSGLNYAISGGGPAIDALKSEWIVALTLNRKTDALLKPIRPASLQQFASRVALTGLVADPGTRFHYSMSLDVLAAVLEKAAGGAVRNLRRKTPVQAAGYAIHLLASA